MHLSHSRKSASSFLSFLLFSILLVTTQQATAQATLFRHVAEGKLNAEIEVESLFNRPSLGGFHPLRIVAQNNQKIPHRFTLRFQDSMGYDSTLTSSAQFSFILKPGETLSQDIIVPLSSQNGSVSQNNLEVTLTGTMGQTSSSTSSLFVHDQPNILLSSSLFTKYGSALDAETISRASTSSHSSAPPQGFASSFDPKRLPNDWRAFSGFDSLLLSDQDWLEIPPGQQNTILSWVRLGGEMIVITERDPSLASLRLPSEASFGSIKLHSVPDLENIDVKAIPNLVTKNARTKSVVSDFKSAWPLQQTFGEKSFNYGLFVLILIAFGILVAPVNLFVFAKPGQRHRLFITTPIISLATSFLLIVLILFQDGFGGDGKRIVLMEVRPDDNQNAAYIRQEQISRTGVVTSPSFALSPAASITPVPITKNRWSRFTTSYDSSGKYDLQPTSTGLAATGAWFQSRSEQGQIISAVTPTRGRIEFAADNQSLISSFDFPIEELIYQDSSKNWFQAKDIKKGTKITATPITPPTAQNIIQSWASQLSATNKKSFQNLTGRQNHYIAKTTSAPAIDTLPSINWQTTTLLTGPISQ